MNASKKLLLAVFTFTSMTSIQAGEPTRSVVIGYTLPNVKSATPYVEIAGVRVKSVEVVGCPSGLAWVLRPETGLLSDPSCSLLFTPVGDELSAIREQNLILGPKPQTCGLPKVRLSAREFVAVHNALKGKRSNQGGVPPTDGSPPARRKPMDPNSTSLWDRCEITGEVCFSPDEVSFSAGCENGGSVTISTNGAVSVSGTPGSFSFGYTVR